jgi:hypothetical protein
MHPRALTVLTAGTLVWLGAVASCYSADATQPDTVTIIGIVKPAPRTAEEAATVLVGKVLYKIVKDAKSQIVARDAANKKAEIKGTLAERNGTKWITITWCALVE